MADTTTQDRSTDLLAEIVLRLGQQGILATPEPGSEDSLLADVAGDQYRITVVKAG